VRAKRITTIVVALGVAVWFVWKLAPGTSDNLQFELTFATALCAAVAIEGLRERRVPVLSGSVGLSAVLCLVLVARFLASNENDPDELIASPAYRSTVAENSQVFAREVRRIRAIPDPVSCSIQTVCYRAGKAFVYDAFTVQQRLATGRASDADIAAAVSGIRFEPIDQRARWRTYS
jgi:hypothetical protein